MSVKYVCDRCGFETTPQLQNFAHVVVSETDDHVLGAQDNEPISTFDGDLCKSCHSQLDTFLKDRMLTVREPQCDKLAENKLRCLLDRGHPGDHHR